MQSRFFWLYQVLGWSLLYAAIMLSVYLSPLFTTVELFFGAVLIGTSALYSVVIRWGFKRWLVHYSLAKQTIYFILQSIIGATLAGFVLVATVFGASALEIIAPISPKQYGYFVSSVFWGNALNVLVAFIIWSALYVGITRARQLKEAKQALATSQLHSLIQQLNPHFLFNMLNNIRALILEDPNRARDALAQLSDMLRYSLNQFKMNKVSFAEELNVVEEYLSLCKIQFEHRLSYKFDVEKEVSQVLIPRMLLQLCAENAIKHGISKLKQGGEISIKARLEQQALRIEINNPIPEIVEDNNRSEETETKVGLSNIKERLKLLYPQRGQEANIQFEKNTEISLAQVTITLPIEYGQE